MDSEDYEGVKKPSDGLYAVLDTFSVEELEARIELLEYEIVRCREMITSKQASLANAEQFFKTA